MHGHMNGKYSVYSRSFIDHLCVCILCHMEKIGFSQWHWSRFRFSGPLHHPSAWAGWPWTWRHCASLKCYNTVLHFSFFHGCTVHLDITKVLLPTDAQENCFTRSIQIYIKTDPSSWYFVDPASQYSLFYLYFQFDTLLSSVYIQYLLSSFLYMFQASQAHHQEV